MRPIHHYIGYSLIVFVLCITCSKDSGPIGLESRVVSVSALGQETQASTLGAISCVNEKPVLIGTYRWDASTGGYDAGNARTQIPHHTRWYRQGDLWPLDAIITDPKVYTDGNYLEYFNGFKPSQIYYRDGAITPEAQKAMDQEIDLANGAIDFWEFAYTDKERLEQYTANSPEGLVDENFSVPFFNTFNAYLKSTRAQKPAFVLQISVPYCPDSFYYTTGPNRGTVAVSPGRVDIDGDGTASEANFYHRTCQDRWKKFVKAELVPLLRDPNNLKVTIEGETLPRPLVRLLLIDSDGFVDYYRYNWGPEAATCPGPHKRCNLAVGETRFDYLAWARDSVRGSGPTCNGRNANYVCTAPSTPLGAPHFALQLDDHQTIAHTINLASRAREGRGPILETTPNSELLIQGVGGYGFATQLGDGTAQYHAGHQMWEAVEERSKRLIVPNDLRVNGEPTRLSQLGSTYLALNSRFRNKGSTWVKAYQVYSDSMGGGYNYWFDLPTIEEGVRSILYHHNRLRCPDAYSIGPDLETQRGYTSFMKERILIVGDHSDLDETGKGYNPSKQDGTKYYDILRRVKAAARGEPPRELTYFETVNDSRSTLVDPNVPTEQRDPNTPHILRFSGSTALDGTQWSYHGPSNADETHATCQQGYPVGADGRAINPPLVVGSFSGEVAGAMCTLPTDGYPQHSRTELHGLFGGDETVNMVDGVVQPGAYFYFETENAMELQFIGTRGPDRSCFIGECAEWVNDQWVTDPSKTFTVNAYASSPQRSQVLFNCRWDTSPENKRRMIAITHDRWSGGECENSNRYVGVDSIRIKVRDPEAGDSEPVARPAAPVLALDRFDEKAFLYWIPSPDDSYSIHYWDCGGTPGKNLGQPGCAWALLGPVPTGEGSATLPKDLLPGWEDTWLALKATHNGIDSVLSNPVPMTFATNLARSRGITSSGDTGGFSAENAVDLEGFQPSEWRSDLPFSSQPYLIVDLLQEAPATSVNSIELIPGTQGIIEKFQLDICRDACTEWIPAYRGSASGPKQYHTFPSHRRVAKLKITFLQGQGTPSVREMGVYQR